MSLLYCVSSVFCFCICFILLLRGPVFLTHIVEKSVTWREFKKYFEKKYLTKRYYDNKMKEFFELKLGSTTIYEYQRRFLELLKYVSFIKDDTIKIQRYLSGFPSFISDKI